MYNNFERTLDNLVKRLDGKIFLSFGSKEVYDIFIKNAIDEGYDVGGHNDNWDIKAINSTNKTIRGGSTFFHMEYYSSDRIYRVDYAKYISGADDFLHEDKRFEFESKFFGNCIIVGRRAEKAFDYYRLSKHRFNTEYDEDYLLLFVERVFKVLIVRYGGD